MPMPVLERGGSGARNLLHHFYAPFFDLLTAEQTDDQTNSIVAKWPRDLEELLFCRFPSAMVTSGGRILDS